MGVSPGVPALGMSRTATPPPSNSSPSLLSPPPRAWALAGWALLPLRLFIGATFMFAGMQKLANPNFFDPNSPASIQAQLIASERVSPIHALTGHLLQFATPLGVLISLSEIAIGLGILLGLWTRIAAVGGAVLSFSLFLTVSFHASPFYTGADIVFFVAFLPFVIAGAGGAPSLDAWIARRAATEKGMGDPTNYVIAFSAVQDSCGNYQDGRCSALGGAACGAARCPVLGGGRQSAIARKGVDEVDRRAVVIGSTAAAAVGVAGGVIAGAAAGLGRVVGGAPKAKSSTSNLNGGGSSGTTTTTGGAGSGTPSGTKIGPASAVVVGGAATFTGPNGDPGVVLQPTAGQFVAYDAICPHAGCTVAYSKAADLLVCPCHASEFKISNGDVIAGPSPTGLTKWKVASGPDGQLYITV